jgi:tetratricopeptide (TPR) repeat protein
MKENFIIKRMLTIFLASISLQVNAETGMWESAVNSRYKSTDPELYRSVEKASNILDSYFGDRKALKQASQLLIKVLKKDDNYAPAYHQLARVAMKKGHINFGNYRPGSRDNAALLLNKAISIEPEYDLALITLSQLHLSRKNIQSAQPLLDKAREFNASSPLLTILQAEIYRDRDKDYPKALRMLRSIKNGDYDQKSVADAATQIAITLRLSRQWEAAENAYYDVVAINPKNPWAHGDLSHYLLFYRKNFDAAIVEGEKALSIMDYPMGRLTTASALYSKWADALVKNEKNADRYFDKAYSMYPDIEAVIALTNKYSYTKMTANALRWKKDNM